MTQIQKEIFLDYEKCNKCGLCQSACPLYKVTRLESYSPRGKVRLTREICNENIDLSSRIKSIFDKCLLCGSCHEICPAQVNGNHLFSGIRWEIAKKQGIHFKKKLLYLILNQPWRLKASARMGRWAQAVFGPALPKIHIGNIPLDRIPKVNEKPFNEQINPVSPAVGKTRAKVLYFHGCATNFIFEKTGLATIDVLTHMGIEVHTPREQGCCGMPIFLSGARQMSLQCIKATVKRFAKKNFDAIIVDCATCGSTLKKEYVPILQDMSKGPDPVSQDLIASAQQIAGKTFDIMEFIARHEQWLPPMMFFGKMRKVTYHDPCHLAKGQGIEKQPRQILQAIPGIEFIESQGARECCGGGGSFQIEHPEISKMITDQKLKSIQDTQADILATGCPSCLLTIGGNLDPQAGITIMHPVEIVKKAIIKNDTQAP